MYERITNYALLKIVFVVGAIIVPTIHELLVWGLWFSIMGFLNISALTCRDRFEYVSRNSNISSSPPPPSSSSSSLSRSSEFNKNKKLSGINSNDRSKHARILTFLVLIFVINIALFLLVITQLSEVGWSVLALLLFEVNPFIPILLIITTIIMHITTS
jgi:hypothetical protein